MYSLPCKKCWLILIWYWYQYSHTALNSSMVCFFTPFSFSESLMSRFPKNTTQLKDNQPLKLEIKNASPSPLSAFLGILSDATWFPKDTVLGDTSASNSQVFLGFASTWNCQLCGCCRFDSEKGSLIVAPLCDSLVPFYVPVSEHLGLSDL